MLHNHAHHTRNIFALLVVAVLLTLGSLARPNIAHACSCMVLPDPQTALAEAPAVFAGRVVDAVPGDAVRYTFEVSRIWKGVASPTVQLFSASSSASCGYEFEQGQEYLVFARVGERGLETSLCSRTAPLADAAADVAALGPGSVPAAETAVPADAGGAGGATSGATTGAVSGAIVVALAALGTLMVWWRRHNRAA